MGCQSQFWGAFRGAKSVMGAQMDTLRGAEANLREVVGMHQWTLGGGPFGNWMERLHEEGTVFEL